MPKGRMLNKRISKDLAVAKLSCRAALLYTWCIPHLDVEGLLEASPEVLKGVVVPYREDFTLAVIRQCVEEISQTDDLIVYYGNTHKYMKFLGFNKNQTINKDREAPSDIPPPTPEELQSNSGLSKVNISKVKYNSKPPSAALRAVLKEVFNDGMNIYALINKLKRIYGWPQEQQFPEEVLIKVCQSYHKNKPGIKNKWPWFCAAIHRASEELKSQEWKQTGIMPALQDLIAKIVKSGLDE